MGWAAEVVEEDVGLGVLRWGADASERGDDFFAHGGDRMEEAEWEDAEMACREEEQEEEEEEEEATARGALTAI